MKIIKKIKVYLIQDLMSLRMVQYTMDNGEMEFVKEKVNKYGMTVQYMKDNGLMEWQMEKED